jgi:hypothetical protein
MKQCTKGRCFAAGSSIHCLFVFQSYILRDFLCSPGSDGTTKQYMSYLSQFDFFAGQRTAIDTGWVLLGARWHLPRLASCRWPVVWNHDITVFQLLVVFTLWDAFPQADLKGSHFLQWQHYH